MYCLAHFRRKNYVGVGRSDPLVTVFDGDEGSITESPSSPSSVQTVDDELSSSSYSPLLLVEWHNDLSPSLPFVETDDGDGDKQSAGEVSVPIDDADIVTDKVMAAKVSSHYLRNSFIFELSCETSVLILQVGNGVFFTKV